MTKIFDLTYGIDGDNIDLEQDTGCGEVERISLHRLHIAHIAGLMGIVKAPPDAEAAQTIAALTRRLLVLRDRVDHLAHWLAHHSDSDHADLSYEQTYATATADIAEEFCAELVQSCAPPLAAPA